MVLRKAEELREAMAGIFAGSTTPWRLRPSPRMLAVALPEAPEARHTGDSGAN